MVSPRAKLKPQQGIGITCINIDCVHPAANAEGRMCDDGCSKLLKYFLRCSNKKTLCQVVLGMFFFFKAEVYYSKLTEEKLLSRQSIEFKRRTMGHLAHSEKCTMPAPSLPISVLRIRHLQLPLTFRWMSTLPEEPWLKAEFGSAGSLSANPPSHSARSLLHPPLNHLLKYKLCVLAHPVVHKGHSEYRFCVLKIIVPFLFCATHLRSIYKRCRFKKKTLQPAELIYNAIEAIKKISCLILLKIRCGREIERVEILHYNERMSYLQGHQIVFVLQSSTNTSNLMQKY